MKRQLFLSIALFVAGSLMAAPVTVLSNKIVAKGYYPRLNKTATELTYLSSEKERYAMEAATNTYVTNEDLKLVLYKNGRRTELYPHGTDVNYIWSSISPDGTKILFNTRKGTAVCDLHGKEIVNLGNYNSPVWYSNDYVVAALEENDGHNFTGGAIVILSLDGQLKQVLTDKGEIGMNPSASYAKGQIAYDDLDGNIHLMQISLAGEAISQQELPTMRKVVGVQPKPIRRIQNATAADFKDFKIYINPGHGGFDSHDNGMKVWMNETYQDYGFWESQSNLDKGLHLNELLKGLGFQTMMSRTQNRTEDDRELNAIATEASNWGADFFLSIHTDVGGPSNYVLQLYSGWSEGDTHQYSSMPTEENCRKGREVTTLMGNLQWSNKITTWNGRTTPYIAGDKTYAKDVKGWSNGYGVLRKLAVPGTISYGAMHDYFPETHRLMNMDYKHQEAWYFMKTFCQYFMNYKQTKGVIGGQVRDAYRKQLFPDIQRIKGSRDEQMPINRATVELLKDGVVIDTYITDTCYNGVFFFWDLEPGEYIVRIPKGQYELRTPTISAEQSFYYSKEATVTVKADEITHVDMMLDAQRSTVPEVISYEPFVANITDRVDTNTSIVLNFNWDMLEEPTLKAFSISPEIEGSLSLENGNRTLRFTPNDGFEISTEYIVTLNTEACHPDTLWPNRLEQDFNLKFRTKDVLVKSVSLDQVALTLTPNMTAQLTATVLPENATNKNIIWSSSHPEVATVVDGLVQPVGAGVATIIATTEDGGYSATCVVTVKPHVEGISINPTELQLLTRTTAQLTATLTPQDAYNTNVIWSTSNPNVATVEDGLVSALSKGTATITATTEDGGLTATCTLTVIPRAESIVLDQTELRIAPRTAIQLIASVLPEDAYNKNVTWSTSNPQVALVDNGLVAAINEGFATITATTEDGGLQATCDVYVTLPVTGIILQSSSLLLAPNKIAELVATVLPINATNQQYTLHVDNTSVVTLLENSWVVARAEGTALITATTDEGGYTATCEVTVRAGVQDEVVTNVTVNPSSNSVDFIWSAVENAASYVFVIYEDSEQTHKLCTLTFNAQGQLVNINFARNKPSAAKEPQEMFTFTVTGLDSATNYAYTMGSYDNENNELDRTAGTFTTTNTTTEVEYQNSQDVSVRKVYEDGTIYILRNGKRYTLDGREVSAM